MAKITTSVKQREFVDGDGKFATPLAATAVQPGIVQFDSNAADIQASPGTASAGGTVAQQAAYSDHVHPWSQAAPAGFAPGNPSSTVSTTQVMMGLGSTCAYTPAGSGLVLVTVTGTAKTTTAQANVTVGARYGTGTAPINGAAVTGTRIGPAADPVVAGSGAGSSTCIAITGLLALTPGTAYWFDLAVSTSNGSDAASVAAVSVVIAELP